jgi:hypothetical protein
MAHVNIAINTDNDAFHQDEYHELSRILMQLSLDVGQGIMDSKRILDTNGNTVGQMVVED